MFRETARSLSQSLRRMWALGNISVTFWCLATAANWIAVHWGYGQVAWRFQPFIDIQPGCWSVWMPANWLLQFSVRRLQSACKPVWTSEAVLARESGGRIKKAAKNSSGKWFARALAFFEREREREIFRGLQGCDGLWKFAVEPLRSGGSGWKFEMIERFEFLVQTHFYAKIRAPKHSGRSQLSKAVRGDHSHWHAQRMYQTDKFGHFKYPSKSALQSLSDKGPLFALWTTHRYSHRYCSLPCQSENGALIMSTS